MRCCMVGTRALLLAAGIAVITSGAGAAQAISLSRGNLYSRPSGPANVSGITYAGGNSYYLVADNGDNYGSTPRRSRLIPAATSAPTASGRGWPSRW